jgi:hypothetical protein
VPRPRRNQGATRATDALTRADIGHRLYIVQSGFKDMAVDRSSSTKAAICASQSERARLSSSRIRSSSSRDRASWIRRARNRRPARVHQGRVVHFEEREEQERSAYRPCRRFSAAAGRTRPATCSRRTGRRCTRPGVNQRHSKLRKLLKLPTEFVPHTFRHTYGTRLGEAGTDAFTIMKLMGNSSETVSQRYVHPTPETLERAVDRLQKLNSENRAAEDLKEKVPQESPPVKSRRAVKLQ